jgi:hypothetical protein
VDGDKPPLISQKRESTLSAKSSSNIVRAWSLELSQWITTLDKHEQENERDKTTYVPQPTSRSLPVSVWMADALISLTDKDKQKND